MNSMGAGGAPTADFSSVREVITNFRRSLPRTDVPATGRETARGHPWVYELKLDGFRSQAIKTGGRVYLRSCNDKDFNAKYPAIVHALALMPMRPLSTARSWRKDESGRPSFNTLQKGSANAPLIYYVFDVMILAGKDVTNEPLTVRRTLLAKHILAKLDEPIREPPSLEASPPDLIGSVKAHGLEGLVAKRRDSRYE
jgi:bifunctional non-homologous end joining protein LigD